MIYGYARVSTHDQHFEIQDDALISAGVPKENIFRDNITGAHLDRPQLKKLIRKLKEGDKIVVWKLDRLGRSLSDLISLVDDFREKGIQFESVTDGINTDTPGGRLIFHVLGAIAEFERDLIRERITAGMDNARKKGVKFGRPNAITPEKQRAIADLLAAGTELQDIAKTVGISRPTLWRFLKKHSLTSETLGNGNVYSHFEKRSI